MRSGSSSKTARYMALIRAAHIDKDKGSIFHDHFAHTLSEEDRENSLKNIRYILSQNILARPLRYLIAARGRFGEERLAAAAARGVKQVVILGAGFDSFSLRNPMMGEGVHVFEVDHPDTQEHKRERLAKAKTVLPDGMTFVPVNFEKDSLAERLVQSGYKADEPGYFLWMGVVPYLNKPAIRSTLQFIASLPKSELSFDYLETLNPEWAPFIKTQIWLLSAFVALVGEPFLTSFTPQEVQTELRALGFTDIEDLGGEAIYGQFCLPYTGKTIAGFPKHGPHFVCARKVG